MNRQTQPLFLLTPHTFHTLRIVFLLVDQKHTYDHGNKFLRLCIGRSIHVDSSIPIEDTKRNYRSHHVPRNLHRLLLVRPCDLHAIRVPARSRAPLSL